MPIDVAHLSYVLSAIASSGKIMESALTLFSKGVAPQYDVLKVEADRFGKEAVSKDDADIIRTLATNIPDGTMEVVRTSIDALQKRVNEILGNISMDVVEKERRIKQEQRHICWYIVQVDNYGPIPDSLYNIWIGNNCSAEGYTLKWPRK